MQFIWFEIKSPVLKQTLGQTANPRLWHYKSQAPCLLEVFYETTLISRIANDEVEMTCEIKGYHIIMTALFAGILDLLASTRSSGYASYVDVTSVRHVRARGRGVISKRYIE